MTTTSTDQEFWRAAEVRAISEIPGFPFESHRALIEAVRNGHALLGVEHATAVNLAHVTASAARAYLLLAMMGLPFLIAIVGSIILPFTHGNWLAFLGLITAPAGMFLATPYMPLKGALFGLSIGALFYSLAAGPVVGGFRWALFSFGASYLFTRGGRRLARDWALDAVLRSEALAAYLYKAGKLYIQDSNGVMHSRKVT